MNGPELFLTRRELSDMTGLAQPAAQIRWLKKSGVRHFVRADGYPRVPRTAITADPVPQQASARAQPNFEGLRQGR